VGKYPHQIEIPIPSGGLGTGQQDMNEFCRSRGNQFASCGIGKLWRKPDRDAVRYCFKNADDAEKMPMMLMRSRRPTAASAWHCLPKSREHRRSAGAGLGISAGPEPIKNQ